MLRYTCIACLVFVLCATAAVAGGQSRGCVELPRPLTSVPIKDGTDYVVAAMDAGNLTVMDVQGDYARGRDAIRQAVAARFYATHPDQFDFLFVFTTFEFETGGAQAFHNILRNDTAGIGRPMIDVGAAYGSPARLQGYIDMAAMSRYAFNPGAPGYSDAFDTLAHELMHRWGIDVHFIDAQGHDSPDLIGQEGMHWSYFLDTDASLMYGSDWQPQDDGTFRSVDIRHRYSMLDLYLAGLAAPSEVGPFMLIRGGSGAQAADLPTLGATTSGTAETITIDQIIAASGPRVPSAADSQKAFTAAMILLRRPGENVPVDRLLELERFRVRAGQQMVEETDGRATLQVYTVPTGDPAVGLPEILHGSGSAAMPPGVAAALTWLEQRQAADGHWQDRPATAMRDTVAAVRAIEELDPGFANLPSARAWLAAHAVSNDDERSWRIVSTHAPNDVSALTAAQAVSGGFGLRPGWNAGAFDTAIVAQALLQAQAEFPSAKLEAALQFVGARQNADGSFGAADGGRGRIMPTLRAASLFALAGGNANADRLRDATAWMNDRWGSDGGLGSGSQSSLSETIEAYSLLGQVPLDAAVAAGMRSYVNRGQQVDGDWGGSVYLTALAMLAYGHNERPNLAFIGAPGVSPLQPGDGDRATLTATVVNTGNVPVGPSVLRWYDGDPLQGGTPIATDVAVPDLAANSRANVTLTWDTTGSAGTHALWAVLDADASIDEASELDNRSHVDVMVSAPSSQPDLMLVAMDFTLDPPAVSSLPSEVRLAGVVRNIGNQGVSNAALRLYARPDLTHPLAETTVGVAARGSTPAALEFTATTASTLNLLLRADPDGAINEGSEANNDVELALPFGESLDLEVLPADLSLLTSPIQETEPADFDVVVRNRGTVDSPPAALRGEIIANGSVVGIFDDVLQVPAGQAVHRRMTWPSALAGPAVLRVAVDEAGQIPEADEDNNVAQLAFDVGLVEQADLAFEPESTVLMPTPALEGQSFTAGFGIRNRSSVAAGAFRVALFADDPRNGAPMIGSTVVPSLGGSSLATATISVPDLAFRGDQRVFAEIDADDQIDEIDESNNTLVVPMRVLSLPDVAISVADITLSPPLPVPGQEVQARATIRNLGDQDAHGITVRLLEGNEAGGTPIDIDRNIASIPAGSIATLTWNWTLGVVPDANVATVVVDPDDALRESNEQNNIAELPFDVQDGGFFASERYISPNGDGIQDAVAVVFAMTQPAPVDVDIVNGSQRVVRHYAAVALNEDFRGQILWDGRDNRGRIVPDGEYRVVAIDAEQQSHGEVVVTVDTDRSSFLEAVDTPYGIRSMLPWYTRDTQIPPESSPAHDQLFGFWGDGGLNRTNTVSPTTVPVISGTWLDAFRRSQQFDSAHITRFAFSPAGEDVVVALVMQKGAMSKLWLLRSAVDQTNSPDVLATFEGGVWPRALGYFDADTIVVGPLADHLLYTIDRRTGQATPLRVVDDVFGDAKVLSSGVLWSLDGQPWTFTPRDPQRAPIAIGESSSPGTYYQAQLSPSMTSIVVHRQQPDSEWIELVDLASGTRTTLAQITPAVTHGEMSGVTGVAGPYLGTGWLAQERQLLVLDASTRTLSTFDESGRRQTQVSFPPLQRTGEYLVYRGQSIPGNVNPDTFPRLFEERCRNFGPDVSTRQRIFDPATDRLFLGLGESVARDEPVEGLLVTSPGIRDYFGVSTESAAVDVVQRGTRIALADAGDAIQHPLRSECEDSPPADWPVLILGDGARLRADGRVQTLSRGTTATPWLMPGDGLVSIWPDETRALLAPRIVFSSLLNLSVELQARTLGRGIELSGIAADRNFAYYRLDWALAGQPNDWHALTPAATEQVFLDEFLTWVPPQPGAFLIRLTVVDKAGNARTASASASSFDRSDIDNFSLDPRYFSPNGDGVQDVLRVKYNVRQAATLDVRITDEQGAVVRSLDLTYGSTELGPAEYDWDGRNDGGAPLPDGRYRFSMAGFGAWVVVDSTPPQLVGRLLQAYRDCPPLAPLCNVQIQPEIDYASRERNPAQILVESATVGMDDWTAVWAGSYKDLPQSADIANPDNWTRFVRFATNFPGRVYRLRATDLAGNARSLALGAAVEVLGLVSVKRTEDAVQAGSETGFVYQPPPFSHSPDVQNPGLHPAPLDPDAAFLLGSNMAVGLVRVAVETAAVDTPDQWVERGSYPLDEVACAPGVCSPGIPNVLVLRWDYSVPPGRMFIRLRGERGDGSRIYSNQGYAQLGWVNPPRCTLKIDDQIVASAEEYFEGPMVRADLHYVDNAGVMRADVITDSTVAFSHAREGSAWVEATDRFGYVHVSGRGAIRCEGGGDGGGLPEEKTWQTGIYPFPVIQDHCDGLPSNRIGLGLHVFRVDSAPLDMREPKPRHVRLTYVNGDTGLSEVLMDDDIEPNARSPWSEWRFSVPTQQWPEGEYEEKLEVTYVDGTTATKTKLFPVVRQAPEISIATPLEGERVCAPGSGSHQSLPFSVNIESATASSYRIGIGAGPHPLGFECLWRFGEAPDAAGNPFGQGCVDGDYADYSHVTDFYGMSAFGAPGLAVEPLAEYNGLSSLQMKGLNWSGGTICENRTIQLDSTTEFGERKPPQPLTSGLASNVTMIAVGPDGDPEHRAGRFFMRSTEPVHVVATLHHATFDPETRELRPGNDALTTLVQGDEIDGDFDFSWDGRIGGIAAPDGLYGVVTTASDGCDHEVRIVYGVIVDATPPTTELISPQSGGPLTAATIQITGRVADNVAVSRWSVDYALPASPDAWQNIKAGVGPVPLPAILGTWSRGTITGPVDLRLSAVDSVGLSSETHVPVVFGEPATLIGSVALQPDLFSPNADGTLDSTRIQVDLLRAANVAIHVVGPSGTTLATVHGGQQGAGGSGYIWDGKDSAGAVVADGIYTVVADATDASIAESVPLAAVVDTIPPVVQVTHPVGAYAAADSTVELHLEDTHFARYEARLTRVDDGVVVASAEGAQSGDVVLALLSGFPEKRHALHVVARDGAGNATTIDAEFDVDATAPAVSLTEPADEALIASTRTTSIKGSVADEHLATWVLEVAPEHQDTWTELKNGSANVEAGEILAWQPGLPDGRYRLRLRATDEAGNASEAVRIVEVDATPPVAQITMPVDGGYLRASAVIEGSATDAHFAAYRLSVIAAAQADGGQWSDIYVGTEAVDGGNLASLGLGLPENDYLLRLTVTDRVGLSSTAQVHVRIDSQAPPAPINLVGQVLDHRDAALEWTAVDASDLAGYIVYRGDERITPTPVESAHYIDEDAPEGNWPYRVCAVDIAGNESTPSNTVSLLIDHTAPLAQILRPVPAERVRGVYDLVGTAYSGEDFKRYTVSMQGIVPPHDASTIATGTLAVQGRTLASWDTSGLEEEAGVRLHLEAEDTHGNVGVADVDVVIDNMPPEKPTGLVAGLVGADAQVHWNANTEPDLLGYLLYRDNGLVNATNPNLPADLRPFALTDVQYLDVQVHDGQHTYVLHAIDRAGNVSPPSDRAALDPLDNAPPSMTIESPANDTRFEQGITVLATSRDTDIASVQFALRKQGVAAWTDLGAPLTGAPYRITWTPAVDVAYGTYEIRALAQDAGGRVDPAPPIVRVAYADLTAPDAPSDLVAQADGGTVHLGWSPSHAADVAGYRIRQDWQETGVPADAVTFDDTDREDGHYVYTIVAFDGSGNTSAPSNQAAADVFSVTLDQPYSPTADASMVLAGHSGRPGGIALRVETDLGQADVDAGTTASTGAFTLPSQPLEPGGNHITLRVTDASGNVSRSGDIWIDRGIVPAAPIGLAAAVDDHLVELAWAANSEADVIGYRVFRNGEALFADGLLGELPLATSDYGWAPELAVDGDLQTYWEGHAHDTESPDDSALQLAWSDPRIVTGLDLTWVAGDAGRFDVFAWSGHVWIRVANEAVPASGTQALVFERPYRTTRLKLVVRGPGYGVDAYYAYRLAEAGLRERSVQGATSLAESMADGAWRYRVSAVSAFAFESALSDEAIAAVGDAQGPDAVVLGGVADGRDARLEWTASDSPDVASYALERDGLRIATIDANSPRTHVDADLPNGVHGYVVYGIDAFGNQGPPSNTVSLTIAGSAPAVPVDVVVTAPAGGGLDVGWHPGSSEPVVLYRVRRALSATGAFDVVTQTAASSYHDNAVVAGTTYYYTIEAVDARGNGSGPSAIASGTPQRDHVAPAPPVLTWPATAGMPLSTTLPGTLACGLAEPAASVSIVRDGQEVSSAPAAAVDIVDVRGLQPHDGLPAPSSSGRLLAARSANGSIRVTSLQDSVTQYATTEEGWQPAWAAHRDIVYFVAADSGKVMRWVPASSASPLVDSVVGTHAFAVNPRETAIAISGTSIADTTPVDGVWLVDAASGAARRVGDLAIDALAQDPSWSPDGRKVVLVDQSGLAHLVDAATAAITRSWPVDQSVQITWKPDASRLVYAVENAMGGDDLHAALASDGSDDRMLAGGARYVVAAAWSPAGGAIAVLLQDAIDMLDPLTGSSLLPTPYAGADADASPWWNLAWTPSGRIAAVSEGSLLLIDPAGWFCADVALVPGLNRLSARATDTAGNHGFASAPIEITFDASARPDLVVTPADLFIVPAAGSVGQRYDALVTVRNTGNAAVAQADLSVKLRAPDGTENALAPGTLPVLAAHGAASVTVPIGTLTVPGMYYLRVTVDPSQVVPESDEGNNTATVAFAVSSDGSPVLDLGLSRTIFAPGETVEGEIAVTNTGGPFSGYVRLDVEDADGFLVAALDDVAVSTLGFGQHWVAHVAWSPDGVLAGDYRLHARLHRANGELLSEREAPFALQAVRHLQLGLTTDASTVAVGHDVVTHSTVSFSDGNALIGGAVLRLGVFDAAGSEVWHREQTLGTLQPGYELARDDAWPTSGYPEGAYVLRLTLLSAQYSAQVESGVLLTAASPVVALAGSLRFDPGATLVAGQNTVLHWRVANAGSVALAGVQVRLRIVAAPGQNPVAQGEDSFDLGVNAAHDGAMPLSAPPLALGAYSALLEARIPGDGADQWRPLARQGFNAVDGMPPEIDLRNPVAGTTTPAVASLVAAVIDRDSIVVAVDASIDGGAWQPLGAGADGLYARGFGGLVDGAHTVSVRARDSWGNEAQTPPRAFTVDATPPAITITGVVDGELANHDLTPFVSVVDAHLQDVAITLDNAPFASGGLVDDEGAHVLLVHATDAAGNSNVRAVSFTIDRTPPPVQIVAPADGSTVAQSAIRVDVHTEPGADVVLATGAYQAVAVADAAGGVAFNAVPLVAGANAIEVVAQDRAGNASAPVAISITYDAIAITPITGTLQPATSALAQGAPLDVHVDLRNPNASALAAQHLRVTVVDDDATQLAEQLIDHDFAAHENHVVDLEFDSIAWPLGAIEVRLDLAAGANWTRLDTQPVDVVDRTPPLLALLAPLTGDVVRSPVTLRANASDVLSGVAAVEYQLDGGDWIALASDAGAYESQPLDLADGDHEVALQAHDGAGNPAHVNPVHFAVDTLPPLINIAGVADGDLVAHAVAPAIDITDAHLFTSDVRLNGNPYVSGTSIDASGEYVLDAIATDLVGNEASAAVHFTIDVDAPLVVFTAPSNDAVVDTASVDVAGQTEANAHVRLSTGAFAVDVDAGDDGVFAVAQVPLQAGPNTIVAHATDRAGNIGPDVQLVVTFTQPLAAVEGQIGAITSPLPYGEPIIVPYAVQNTGALPLVALQLRLELRDDVNGDLASSDDFTLDLPLAADASGERALPAAGLAAGGYVLTLLADLPGDSAGSLVLDSRDVTLSSAGCRHGDMIFVDGFDGTGVIRDGLIFCDGFDVVSVDGMPVAMQAPWLGTTAWIAAIDAPLARRADIARATARALRQPVASRSSERAIGATLAGSAMAGKAASKAATTRLHARCIESLPGERRDSACFPPFAAWLIGRDGYEDAPIGRSTRAIAAMHTEVL